MLYAPELLPSFVKFFQQRVRHHTLGVRWMCGILKRKPTNDSERSVFHSFRYEHSRCKSRIVCALNTLGFYCVTITYSSLEYSKLVYTTQVNITFRAR